MTNTSNELCPECLEAEEKSKLDIHCVRSKLESVKKAKLDDWETRYLCLWLCSVSSYEVAFRLYRSRRPTAKELNNTEADLEKLTQRLREDMSEKVHFYIKQLMGIQEKGKRIPTTSAVVLFFREEGCEKRPPDQKFNQDITLFFGKCKGKISKQKIENA
ncbi:MAG TPA: hypothetical protein DDW76_03860 [Cyanobacteria bacterium UBA11369]|nr:hypothetical protein [Cyanobacteria bacterium UBA11371]HBE35986.1 hypothetical protein [Cyanobacteria bacterium UBA11368]HBE47951.1 hypothetical protein [Cyanobacteria bacterium UBA11369]